MAETQGASASEQWSLAHSVALLGQTGHMLSGHKGPVLLRLEVPLKKVGLLKHLGEGFAHGLVLGRWRLHRGWGCGSWLPATARLMTPWVDRLRLPKWQHRWG